MRTVGHRRAKGHVRIPVRAKPPLEPAFTVPDNIEPEQEVTVQIECPDAPAGTKLHVWAIDEGIVRLSGSEVPNPSRSSTPLVDWASAPLTSTTTSPRSRSW